MSEFLALLLIWAVLIFLPTIVTIWGVIVLYNLSNTDDLEELRGLDNRADDTTLRHDGAARSDSPRSDQRYPFPKKGFFNIFRVK